MRAEVSEVSWLPKFMILALKSPVSQQTPFDRAEKVQPWILRGP